jgi:excisionase family DNA binding protein
MSTESYPADATLRAMEALMRAPAQPTRLAFTPHEVAQSLGVSYHTVLRMIADGRLREVPGTRTKIIPASSVYELLQSSAQAAVPPTP